MSNLLKADTILHFVRSVDFPYHTSSIFPSEMAYFLYCCEQVGVDCIIESGRYEGYSTAVIGAYGKLRTIRVVSVDLETDALVAQRCRESLQRYPNVELVAGDAFWEIPRFLRSKHRSIALLLDGPKFHKSIYLSAAAAACGRIRIIAHHNMAPESAYWYAHFAWRFPQPQRLEDSHVFHCPSFAQFRDWELNVTRGSHRNLHRTSLMISILPHSRPDLRYLMGPSLRHTLGAVFLHLSWRVRLDRMSALRKLFAMPLSVARRFWAATKVLQRAGSTKL